MKKPLKETRFFKFAKSLLKNTFQTTPIVGTIITAAEESKPDDAPKGIALNKWHYFRLALGVIVAYAMYKGIVDTDFINTMTSVFTATGV